MSSNEARLNELEMRVAFQDDTIQALNDIVADQQRQLEQLASMIKVVNRQVKSLDPGTSRSDGDEPPPPHY